MTTCGRRSLFGKGWLAVIGLCATILPAGEPQTRFFDQLRSRQLYGPAERYCLEKLARENLPPSQRIDFTYELSRTFAQHALVAEPDQQAELWERALKVLGQARQQVGSHERITLLELQSGFVDCAHGDALRWQLALAPDDGALRKQALHHLRSGIEKLVPLDGELKSKLRKPPPKDVEPQDRFNPGELRGLILTTEFELGKAYYSSANLIPEQDADRPLTIQDAEKWLNAALNADRGGEVGQSSQVLLAGCARLRIDANRALRLLDELQEPTPPQAIADMILAERARVFLMQKKPVEAADLLANALKSRDNPPGELVSLRIEVLIELWVAATEKSASDVAGELQSTIDQQLQRVQTTNPGYWAAYCESLVAQAREVQSLGKELAEQVRQARILYGNKQSAAAMTAYATAAQAARTQNRQDVAFDLDYTRGSIEIEAKHFADAVQTFEKLATQNPQHPRAPDADFLATYALGQIYAASPTRQNREAYTSHLEAQRANYPTHTSAGEATWLLGQLEEKRLQNSAAIRLYQQIPANHPRAAVAAAACARCYDRLLERLRDLKQPTEAWQAEAIERLQRALPTDQAASLTENQAILALHLSNIILQSDKPDFAAADSWLERVARSARNSATGEKGQTSDRPDMSPAWLELNRGAARLRVVSLAGQERYAEAEKTLTDLTETSPTELLWIIDGLSKLVAQAQAAPRHHLGELQLRAALHLQKHREKLAPADQDRLDLCVAEAYVAAGRYEHALDPFRAQLKARPDDVALLTNYAQLLMKFGQRPRTEEARTIWKRLESRHKSGSAGWFEARYQTTRCELLLGNPDAALKLIGVTKVLFPQLGGPSMQQKFQELAEACENRKKSAAAPQ